MSKNIQRSLYYSMLSSLTLRYDPSIRCRCNCARRNCLWIACNQKGRRSYEKKAFPVCALLSPDRLVLGCPFTSARALSLYHSLLATTCILSLLSARLCTFDPASFTLSFVFPSFRLAVSGFSFAEQTWHLLASIRSRNDRQGEKKTAALHALQTVTPSRNCLVKTKDLFTRTSKHTTPPQRTPAHHPSAPEITPCSMALQSELAFEEGDEHSGKMFHEAAKLLLVSHARSASAAFPTPPPTRRQFFQ